MPASLVHFISLYATLLAIINPLEAIPVFLDLLKGKGPEVRRKVAKKACLNALYLMFFFLIFGTLLLSVFGVSLSMIRIVGGIVLMRIGFALFSPSSRNEIIPRNGSTRADGMDVAFTPLAMPIMFGPGGIATLISMASTLHLSLAWKSRESFEALAASSVAIVATMLTIYVCLASSEKIYRKFGSNGIDAATRLTGFFVSAMGVGLIVDGVGGVLQVYGVIGPQAGVS